MSAQDRVRTDQQQETAEPLPRQVVEQPGRNRTIDIAEDGPPGGMTTEKTSRP